MFSFFVKCRNHYSVWLCWCSCLLFILYITVRASFW